MGSNKSVNKKEKKLVKRKEYGGFVMNLDTGLRECLFVTECSELLAKNRALEKARIFNESGSNYSLDDILVKERTVETFYGNWTEE